MHTGHWIDDADSYICSVCGYTTSNPNKNITGPAVCPQCFAKMDTGHTSDSKRTVAFDFDGVIHSYKSGWKGTTITPDPVVPGIREVIRDLRDRGYEVVVYSTRASSEAGMNAITSYLHYNGIEVDRVCCDKPIAIVYVDDRALTFNGDTSGLVDRITSFRSWTEVEQPSFDNQCYCTGNKLGRCPDCPANRCVDCKLRKLKSTPMIKNDPEIGYWVNIRKWWQGGSAYKACSVCKTLCFMPFKRLKECPCCHSKMVKEAPR